MRIRVRTIGLVLIASLLLWVIPSIAGIAHTAWIANSTDRLQAAITSGSAVATAARLATYSAWRSILLTESLVALLGLVGLVVFAIVLDRTILKRLADLGAAVRDVAIGDEGRARVPVEGDDEISGLARDINTMLEQLDDSRSELQFLALHDPLTGLSNRKLFEQELQRELDEHERLSTSGTILWFDLDHFKEINDRLGHAAGDEVLRGFASHLRTHSRSYSTVARLGGDEFAVLVPHSNDDEAAQTADRLLDELSACRFLAGTHDVRVSASVGIVAYPRHGARTPDLLSKADLAMYDAKAKGGNQAVVYRADDGWEGRLRRRIEEAERVIDAFREERFVLFAQPIRAVRDARADRFELLLRMEGDGGEFVPAAEIIPVAERLGLMHDIDRWVVRRGIRLLGAAERLGNDAIFAVNLSGHAFSDPLLLGIVRDALQAEGASPERFAIEIAESTTIAAIDSARVFIGELRNLGCQFSLDDFGSGASSFYYLKHLAIDCLKIDGTLIKTLGQGATDEHFVNAIVQMCKGLGISTVAQHVESESICEAAERLGVDYAQGYYAGRPETIESYFGTRIGQMARADAAQPISSVPSVEAV